MTYRVVIDRRALEGIGEAYDWIAERAPHAAEQWLEGIKRTIAALDTLPRRCAIAPESELAGKEIRRQLYGRRSGKYRILFVIREDTVHVIDVRHGARKPLTAREIELPDEEEEAE